MAASMPIHDVDTNQFNADVIERSRQAPVVVDFWAPWCGPCRLLGPTLEKLVLALDGRIELARINTDENPALAQAFQVTGIPAVKAFRDGQVVSEFTGALPEAQVQLFLQRLLPSEADALAEAAVTLAYSGDSEGAEREYQRALEADKGHRDAALGLARLLIARGAELEAATILERIPTDAEARQVLGEIRFGQAATGEQTADLEARLVNDPADVDAHYRLGMTLAAQGQYQSALEHLLEVVRRDRGYQDDAARKAMLDIFAVLGDGDPWTQQFRRLLSSVLF